VVETINVAIAAVNDFPNGAVTISGTATEDETLTAVTSTISDEDGLGEFSYQWFADDVAITNATESTLTLSQAEVDKAITVKVSYTDGYDASEELTSSASGAVISAALAITTTITDRFGNAMNSAEAHAYEDSVNEISATSTADNVTIFETASGTDLLIGGLLAPNQSNRNFWVAFERVLNATNSPLPTDCPVAARITT